MSSYAVDEIVLRQSTLRPIIVVRRLCVKNRVGGFVKDDRLIKPPCIPIRSVNLNLLEIESLDRAKASPQEGKTWKGGQGID